MASYQYSQYTPWQNITNTQYNNTLAGYDKQYAEQQQLGQGINKGYNAMFSSLSGFGDAQRTALNQQYQRQLSQSQQDMVGRGLYNTSAYDSAQRGVNYDYNNSATALNDQLLQQRLGVQGQQLGYQAQLSQQLSGIRGAQNQFMGAGQQQSPLQTYQYSFDPSQMGGASSGTGYGGAYSSSPSPNGVGTGGLAASAGGYGPSQLQSNSIGGVGGGAPGVGGSQWGGGAWMQPSGLTGGNIMGGYGAQPQGGGGGYGSQYGYDTGGGGY